MEAAGSTGFNRTMIPPRTERLEFRRFTPEDAELLVELDSDPEVMRYLTEGRPTPREVVVNEVMPRVIGMYDRLPGRGVFAAFTEGRFVGWFHLKPGHYWPEELELGYRLRREYWGKGLATEGSRGLIDFSFGALNEACVIATTLRVNLASRRVMEKVGMRFERAFTEERWPGADKGAVKYRIDRA